MGAAAPAVEALLAVVEVVARLAPERLFSAVVMRIEILITVMNRCFVLGEFCVKIAITS